MRPPRAARPLRMRTRPTRADSAPKPATSPVSGAEAGGPVSEPVRLDGPRGGKADDLKKIKGVGPKLEGVLHDLGIYHYDQVASWSDAEVAWADRNLVGFKGRVSRDEWVPQARELASGGETDFSRARSAGAASTDAPRWPRQRARLTARAASRMEGPT